MRLKSKVIAAAAAATLGFVPAAAIAHGSPGTHGNSTGHSHSSSANAKKYGKLCQRETNTHVKGQKGTPFSNCVNDLAKVAHNSSESPRQACSNETKKHVSGQKGTPYSNCVSAGAKLRRSQKSHGGSDSTSSGGS